jgi:CRP/FNR family transcriptional regulator
MTLVTDLDEQFGAKLISNPGVRMSAMHLSDTENRVLSNVPLFSGLDRSELEFIAGRAIPRKYASGQMVFNEGDPCSGLYVVMSGQVRIFKTSASGREQVLSIDGPGSSIAELPVFDGGNYPASGRRS